MEEKLDSKSEKILFYIRDKEKVKSSRIEHNIDNVDRDAVNYRIRKMRNLGLVSSEKDRTSVSGGAEFAKDHYPNLNKIDEYETLFGKLDVPEYKKAERYGELVRRVEKLEESDDEIWSKINEIEDILNYIRDWVDTAEKYLVAIRMYFNKSDSTKFDIYLDSAEQDMKN